ncbi:MAG: hypothetical protein U5K32_13205 [Bacteroidales bacterium]|nr:hypothetical protein [Bacteroidales bacterium]
MKFIKAFTSGAGRALRSVKALLIMWFITFIMLAVFAFPLRSFIIAALGNTTSTSLLNGGFNISYFMDLGRAFGPMMSAITGGMLIAFLIFFLLYVFMNGGLFDSLLSNSYAYKPGDFFRSSARFFLSYMIITLLVMLMILVVVFIVAAVPLIIQGLGTGGSEQQTWKLAGILRIVVILVLPVFLLVADYSRVWLAANDHRKVFKALGYGFRATFRSFLSSYFFMLIMVVVQGFYAILLVKILSAYSPLTGGGLFVLFLLTQLLFLFKLYLRAVRYGGVAALYQI